MSGLLILCCSIAISSLIERTEFMQYLRERNFEAWTREAAVLLRPPANPGNPFGLIRVVEITQSAYDDEFASTSPLDPAKVKRLAQIALEAGALAVAVDLNVDRWTPADFDGLPDDARLVWIMPPASHFSLPGCLAHADLSSAISRYTGRIAYHPGPERIAGRQLLPLSEVLAGLHDQRNPNLTCPALEEEGDSDSEPQRIRFITRAHDESQSRPAIARSDAGDLLRPGGAVDFVEAKQARGQLVLIGATFAESRDRFLTPFGLPEAGVDIYADLLASEISGGALRDESDGRMLAFDWAIGVALLVLIWFARLRGAQEWILMLLPFSPVAIGLILSLANFLSLRQFISFSPFILGIIVDECLDLVEKNSHLKKLVNALSEKAAAKANEEIVQSAP